MGGTVGPPPKLTKIMPLWWLPGDISRGGQVLNDSMPVSSRTGASPLCSVLCTHEPAPHAACGSSIDIIRARPC